MRLKARAAHGSIGSRNGAIENKDGGEVGVDSMVKTEVFQRNIRQIGACGRTYVGRHGGGVALSLQVGSGR